MHKLLALLFLVHHCSGIIYKLNDTEYYKMPPLYKMEDYDSCLAEPGGTFCLTESVFYSNQESELMRTLQEYSEYKMKHYNHTIAHRALCIQRACKDFMQNKSLDNEEDIKSIVQDCVNSSIWNEYHLNTKLSKILYCQTAESRVPVSTGDYIMTAVLLGVLILNCLGTAYDIIMGDSPGCALLLSFSLKRNWKKMVATAGKDPEPRLNLLKVFNGMRALTMVCVIFSHASVMTVVTYLHNPEFIETSYEKPASMILYNGTMVTYTFFVMSGFLLAFKLELHAEKHKISIWDWPKGMLMRWLRLTPVYALVMFTEMTVLRHVGNGPLWPMIVTSESVACNQWWWSHLIYVNNYIYENSLCMPQTWYLAADTQLFGLGLLMCILVRRPRSQIIALIVMLIVSLTFPAFHIYFEGLGAVVIQSPESYRNLYATDDTFRVMYIRSHTNMSTYVLGIAGGLIAYHWLKNEKAISARLQKFPWVVWLSCPVAICCIMLGGLFYMDGVEQSTFVKVLYGTIAKPFFQLNMLVIMMGCIFKVEKLYRGILEWDGFTWLSRVSYSAFLLHVIFQRLLLGSQRLPTYVSEYYVIVILLASITLSFGCGAILWLTVESPLAGVTKIIMTPPRKPRKETEDEEDTATK